MFCHKCGTEVFEGEFCPNCGHKIIKTSTIDNDTEASILQSENLDNEVVLDINRALDEELEREEDNRDSIKEKLITVFSGTIRVIVFIICAMGIIVAIAGILAGAYIPAGCLAVSMFFFWRFGSIVRNRKKALKGLTISLGLFVIFVIWLALI